MGVMNFQVNGLVQEALASPKREGMVTNPFLCGGVVEFPSQWFGSRGFGFSQGGGYGDESISV